MMWPRKSIVPSSLIFFYQLNTVVHYGIRDVHFASIPFQTAIFSLTNTLFQNSRLIIENSVDPHQLASDEAS